MAKRELSKDEVRKMVKDENIRFLRVMFTDMLGTIKSVDLPVSQLDKLMDNKIMFDGSSIAALSGLKKVICTCTQICQLGWSSHGGLSTGRLPG